MASEQFPSRKQHLDFRGHPHLLQLCEKLDSSGTTREPGRHSSERATLNYYANTLVRHGSDNVVIKRYGGLVAVFNNAKGELATNLGVLGGTVPPDDVPHADGLSTTTSINQDEEKNSSDSTRSFSLESGDILEFILEKTMQAREQGLHEIKFVDHASYYLDLLRACHTASATEFARARDRFKDYVLFSSVDNIGSRLRIGRQRNLEAILTTSHADIPKARYHEPISVKLSGLPSAEQSEYVFRFARGKGMFTEKEAIEYSRKPIYDRGGRKRFHIMLSRCLNNLYASQQLLAEEIDTVTRPVIEARIPVIKELFIKFAAHLRKLDRFLRAFDVGPDDQNPLLVHLAWLYNGSGAGGLLDKDGLFSEGEEGPNEHPLSSSPIFGNGEHESGEEGEEISRLYLTRGWAHAARKFLRTLNSHTACMSRVTYIEPDDSENSAKRRYESSIVKSSAVAVLDVKYGEEDKNRTSLADCIDQLITPSSDLSEREKCPQLNREEILAYLYKHCVPKKQGFQEERQKKKAVEEFEHGVEFSGSMHCETMLIAASACVNRTDLAETTNEPYMECSGKLSADANFCALKRLPRQLITASKRCCPSCRKVAEQTMQICPEDFGAGNKGRGRLTDVLESQHNTKWTAVALPPNLPLIIAEKVLSYAPDEALKALVKVQAKVAKQKEWVASLADEPRTRSRKSEDMGEWPPSFNAEERYEDMLGLLASDACFEYDDEDDVIIHS